MLISGIAANICCDTTAREASQRDYRVVFLSDGTATREMNGVPAAELQRLLTLASLGNRWKERPLAAGRAPLGGRWVVAGWSLGVVAGVVAAGGW